MKKAPVVMQNYGLRRGKNSVQDATNA